MCMIPAVFYVNSSEKGLKGDSNPDLCKAGAVLRG